MTVNNVGSILLRIVGIFLTMGGSFLIADANINHDALAVRWGAIWILVGGLFVVLAP